MTRNSSNGDDRTVWVGNLDNRVTEEILWELFLQAGPLESVKIPKDYKSGRPKNFAFVVFQHQVSVDYVIRLMNQIKLYETPIRLSLKNKPPSENASSQHDQEQMRHHDLQDKYNSHSPLPPQPLALWPAMFPGMMSHPTQQPFGIYPEEAYLQDVHDWQWEEPRLPRRRREDILMRRSYSSPHRLHEESHRSEPYHYRRRPR